MTWLVLSAGFSLSLAFTFWSIDMFNQEDYFRAWNCLAFMVFIGRWTANYWLNNGETVYSLQLPENAWYLDFLKNEVVITFSIVQLAVAVFAASIKAIYDRALAQVRKDQEQERNKIKPAKKIIGG